MHSSNTEQREFQLPRRHQLALEVGILAITMQIAWNAVLAWMVQQQKQGLIIDKRKAPKWRDFEAASQAFRIASEEAVLELSAPQPETSAIALKTGDLH